VRLLSKLWPRTRRRRAIAWAAIALAAAATLCAVTRLDEALVASALGRRLGVKLAIDDLDWLARGAVRARKVDATFPASHRSTSEPFLAVASAEVELGLLPPRVKSVSLERPRLVATERPDGRLDLEELLHGGRSARKPPALHVHGGELELCGEGPLHERMRRVLACDVPARLEIERLSVVPADDRSVDVNGSLFAFGRIRLRLSGRIHDGRVERADAWIRPDEAIDVASLRPLASPAAKSWLEENAVAGRVAGSVRLDPKAGEPQLAADVELRGLSLKLAVFPCTVSDMHGFLRLRGRNLSLDRIAGRHRGAAVSIGGEIADLGGTSRSHVTVRIDGASVDEELLLALEQDKVGREVVAALAPEGRFSVIATVDSDASRPSPHLALEIDLEECAGVFHGFADSSGERHGLPMRVERIRGHVHAAPEGTSFDDTVGFTRGGASVKASARLVDSALSGIVNVFDAPVDEELLAATDETFGPIVRDVVRELGLDGRFDAAARFGQSGDGGLELSIDLSPREITLAPPSFPYPVVVEGGCVRLDDGGVTLDRLHGRAGGGTVSIDGRIEFAAEGEADAPLSIVVRARGVAIDDELLRACHALGDERIAAFLDEASPQGSFDVELAWTRTSAGAPLERSVRLAPRDVRLGVGGGSAELRAVHGVVTLCRRGEEPWRFDLESEGGITASCFDGTLHLRGRSDESGQGALRVTGGRLRVGAELYAGIEPFQPDLAALLAASGIDGRIRIDCRIEPRDGRLTPTQVDVEPDVGDGVADEEEDGVRVAPPWLALGVRWLDGAMHADLDLRRITFDRISGFLGDAHLEVAGGSLAIAADGLTARLAAGVDALPFAQAIELVFGAEQRRALVSYGPLGRARIAIHELSFHMPSDGSSLDRIVLQGAVDFEGFTFYTGGGLRDLSGRLDVLDFSLVRKSGDVADVRANGRLSDVTLGLGDVRFADLEADLVLEEGRLSVPWLSADLAGGRLPREKNHVAITLLGEMPFDGRLELQSGDVSRMLGDDDPRLKELVGRVDADVDFRGSGRPLFRGAGITDLEAAGTVTVHEAKLWSIPLFDRLYSRAVLPLVGTSEGEGGVEEPPKWTRGAIEFALQGAYVRLPKVELEGKPLVLRGEGTLGPDRLAINFYPEVKTGVGFVRSLPVLGWILDPIFSLVEHEIGAFRFQGPYGDPDVEWDPVSLVPRPDLAIRLERPRTSSARDLAAAERF